MTEQEATEAVLQHWKLRWDVLHPPNDPSPNGCPWTRENKKFSPTIGLPWARVTLRPTDANQHTLGARGARKYRRDANIWVQLYVPLDEGTSRLNTLIDHVRQVFEGESIATGMDPINAARVVPVGKVD